MNYEHLEEHTGRLLRYERAAEWEGLDVQALARDTVLASAEEAARQDPEKFTELALDVLLAPEEWDDYAAEIEGGEAAAASGEVDAAEPLAQRVAEHGLACLSAGELAQVMSSARAFRAVTGALRRLSSAAALEESMGGGDPPSLRVADLDPRTREALLLMLEGRSVHQIAIEMRLDLPNVLASLAWVRTLLERGASGRFPRSEHLDLTVSELARIAGHPLFWQRWGGHLAQCARCRELFGAALRERLYAGAARGDSTDSGDHDDDTRAVYVRCLALWCLRPRQIEDMVSRWLSIDVRELREECLFVILDAVQRSRTPGLAQQTIAAFIRQHDECSCEAESEWIAVIGRFQPCNALDPGAWDESLSSRLPGWFGQALMISLHENRNREWESRVQNWRQDQPWQRSGFQETYEAYLGWVASYRGE
jgi:hypothetical protein